MNDLNIDFLINTPIENILEKIRFYFDKVIQEIESYLNIEAVQTKVNINLKDKAQSELKLQIDIFSIGVERIYSNELLTINIYSDYFQFIPMILLREAYKTFIPKLDAQIEMIDIFINQKVSIDLKKIKGIKKWKTIISNNQINYEFISREFDRLENFLKRDSGTENVDSPFKFFFKFVRRNIRIINEKKNDFYDTLFNEYLLLSSKSLYDDEIIETIRILAKIFDKVQYYRALLDYQDYFRLYKENGFIQTHLSSNKFTKNMQWIREFSDISPSYKINWPTLDLYTINCFIKFNPLLKRSKITFIKEMPFFILLKECRNSFSLEIDGYFVIPKKYFDDLKRFFKKLEDFGYILQFNLIIIEKNEAFFNLNYFREFHNLNTIVNSENKLYDKKYELKFRFDYGNEVYESPLSLIDWLIIDRIPWISLTGFNFEKQAGTLKLLKADIMNEIISQQKFINDLKTNLSIIHSLPTLGETFSHFLKTNESFGFFYVKNILSKYIIIFGLIKEILENNPSIRDESRFIDHIKRYGVSYSIENNIVFKDSSIKKELLNKFLPLYFKSKSSFEVEIEKFTAFSDVFNSCYDLKIFNLHSIHRITKNKQLLNTIFKSKEEKLKSSYESYKLSEITYQLIEDKLDTYLNMEPPVIKPNLFATILISLSQCFVILLKNNSETVMILREISFIAKRMEMVSGKIISVVFFLPYINNEEKSILISILTNLFKTNLISFKRFVFSGLQKKFSRKDFYDLEEKKFFYTQDLFKQFFLNVKNIIGDVQNPLPEIQKMQQKRFWFEENDVSYLIKEVEDRVRKETIDLNLENLRKLLEFHNLLGKNILNIEEFKKSQEKFFFKNCIKTIDFIPSFQNFGMSQYFLYFYPTDIENINFKLLMNNAFQSISYPAQIDNSNSFLIQYIYPYRNPGILPYVNWLTKSNKIIREYCLFFIKKFYQILHFDYNLSSEGWDLDPNRFKIYFQNILFNPDYKVQIPDLKEFNVGDINSSNYFGPNSSEFKALSQIYAWKSLDIKSYLTRRYFKINTSIIELLKKGLIQPFISLKNLDVVEEITIILPDVKKEHNESILKIFSFFNIGFIYEMEGEYYIHGFDEVIKFENGIMIKLYFPDCQIDEFEKLFDLLFEYMEIDHYLILNDLIDGENLLKSTFNGLKFLETYNPLINLIWNVKDKKWRNHKLFNENFEPVYPDLFFGKKNYDLDS